MALCVYQKIYITTCSLMHVSAVFRLILITYFTCQSNLVPHSAIKIKIAQSTGIHNSQLYVGR